MPTSWEYLAVLLLYTKVKSFGAMIDLKIALSGLNPNSIASISFLLESKKLNKQLRGEKYES